MDIEESESGDACEHQRVEQTRGLGKGPNNITVYKENEATPAGQAHSNTGFNIERETGTSDSGDKENMAPPC